MLFTKKKENVFQKLIEAITATSTVGQVPADDPKTEGVIFVGFFFHLYTTPAYLVSSPASWSWQ